MAYFKFANLIRENKPIDVYNNGEMRRDFTYIDDIVAGVIKSIELTGHSYEICNLGNDQPVLLTRMIEILEDKL